MHTNPLSHIMSVCINIKDKTNLSIIGEEKTSEKKKKKKKSNKIRKKQRKKYERKLTHLHNQHTQQFMDYECYMIMIVENIFQFDMSTIHIFMYFSH